MAVGETAVRLGVDLFAGTKVDESINVSRAAAGQTAVLTAMLTAKASTVMLTVVLALVLT